MTINDINITEYSAELVNREISSSNYSSTTQWNEGMIDGLVISQKDVFRTIKLTFVIKTQNEDEAFKKTNLLSSAFKKSKIKFDDIDLVFDCVLDGIAFPARCVEGVFKVTFTLKNSKAVGETVNVSFDVEAPEATKITINYIDNIASVIPYYTDGYEEKEYFIQLSSDACYVDNTKIAVAANSSTDWTSFFLSLGLDVNKYKPKKNNTSNGVIDIETEYSSDVAESIFDSTKVFNIYYNRFQKDNIPDFPTGTIYPAKTLRLYSNNVYCFNLGVGKGLDPSLISILFYGRNFKSDSNSGSNLYRMDSSCEGYFRSDSVHTWVGDNTDYSTTILDSKSSSAGGFTMTFISDASGVPISMYGIKSDYDPVTDSAKQWIEYVNSSAVRYIPSDGVSGVQTEMNKNIILLKGNLSGYGGVCHNCDFARVQVYYKDKIIRDAIPIDGSLKNGFVNTYDCGLYDINTMEYIPWVTSGDVEPSFNSVMTLPAAINYPN